jgi:hypothetical protein
MVSHHESECIIRAIAPIPVEDRPARFEPWPADVKTRAFELWSTVALSSAPRTACLLAQEADEGVAVPADLTIRMWAKEDEWAAQRDETLNLDQTAGNALRQLQAWTVLAIALAQDTMIDAMTGLLDDKPYGGSGRIKAAEGLLRLAERSGISLVCVTVDARPEGVKEQLTLAERSRRMREQIVENNVRGW